MKHTDSATVTLAACYNFEVFVRYSNDQKSDRIIRFGREVKRVICPQSRQNYQLF